MPGAITGAQTAIDTAPHERIFIFLVPAIHVPALSSAAMVRCQPKFRPDNTTSERQLASALSDSGRQVSLNELSNWRKDGLLPPLASTGAGMRAGRCYYWREPDILAQAQTVYDCLQKHGRTDETIVLLWLHGFSVTPKQLRRAWLYRARLRPRAKIRVATSRDTPMLAPNLSSLLIQAIIGIGAAANIQDDNVEGVLALLERASIRLGYSQYNSRPNFVEQLWLALRLMTTTLEAGDLIRQTSDDELLEAKQYMHIALLFLQSSGETACAGNIVEVLGPTLFIFALAMQQSGQTWILEAARAKLDHVRRQQEPAQLQYARI